MYYGGGGGGGGSDVPLIGRVVGLHLHYPSFLHARKTMPVICILLFSELCEMILPAFRTLVKKKESFLVSLLAQKKGFPFSAL